MSTRHIVFLIFALVSASNMGCCGTMRGCGSGCDFGYGGQMYGSNCASCGYPEASCCCEDVCCEASCGCEDVCCEASCGCDDVYGDVGCGSGIGTYPMLGNCWFLQRLRMAFRNTYGCYGGCSSEGYWSEWHNDPPCNCQAGGYTGGHYGGAYGRRAYLAKQHQNISEELRFADEDSGPTFR